MDLDQFAARRLFPDRYDYPTLAAYESDFHLWRALRRDARLTDAELDARYEVVVWAVQSR